MKCFLNRDYVENFVRYHKKEIVKVAIGFSLFMAAFFVFCFRDSEEKQEEFSLISGSSQQVQENEVERDSVTVAGIQEEVVSEKPKKIYIDISGAVEKPYVYEMQEGDRVYEAIALAGGLLADADISTLNLAQALKDEDKITIYTKEQIQKGQTEMPIQKGENSGITNGGSSSQPASGSQAGLRNSSGMVNLNTANSEALQTINGIGPSTAEKILVYRTEHGSFKKIEELMNVSGIGEKTFAKLKDKITV
ncbi:hypothetical protein Ami103574_08655 [Aminipila butyrica]|uniref:Helix-hairpin-helix DNA-binding motif class 1 domain-containing protein n=1 Tax=Aminipila butyrica TaxID=433296 RepID=A0A858BVF3_9FIRM|nr:helix-hairpin-helix domain-containing protein [Aminipila butyrica]QIB69392.1 hypothetical protein Ami103574_08655 [Aminipila butyrica]